MDKSRLIIKSGYIKECTNECLMKLIKKQERE